MCRVGTGWCKAAHAQSCQGGRADHLSWTSYESSPAGFRAVSKESAAPQVPARRTDNADRPPPEWAHTSMAASCPTVNPRTCRPDRTDDPRMLARPHVAPAGLPTPFAKPNGTSTRAGRHHPKPTITSARRPSCPLSRRACLRGQEIHFRWELWWCQGWVPVLLAPQVSVASARRMSQSWCSGWVGRTT